MAETRGYSSVSISGIICVSPSTGAKLISTSLQISPLWEKWRKRVKQAENAAGEHFFASFLDRSIVSVPIACRTSCGFWQCQTQPSPSGFLSLSLSLWRTGLLLKPLQVSLRASSIIHQPVKQDRHTLPQPRDAPLIYYQ